MYDIGYNILEHMEMTVGIIWPGVVVPVKVPFMSQIDQFKNYSYRIGMFAKKLF